MKFSALSTTVKAITTTFVAVVAALAIVWGWGSLLHTDAEAQEHVDDFNDYQVQQYRSDKFERIDRVEAKIAEIDFQLLTDNLPEKKVDYLEKKRTDLKDKKDCIQKDEC
jgi:hypothetical protein